MESWIVETRRKTCIRCPRNPECRTVPAIIQSLFAETTECPENLHPSRLDAIAARAWPEGIPPISGCC